MYVHCNYPMATIIGVTGVSHERMHCVRIGRHDYSWSDEALLLLQYFNNVKLVSCFECIHDSELSIIQHQNHTTNHNRKMATSYIEQEIFEDQQLDYQLLLAPKLSHNSFNRANAD